MLLRRNANTNAATQYGWTPLMLAAFYGHIPIVGLLIEGGANLNAVCTCRTDPSSPVQSSAMRGSALMCAIRNGHSWIVHSLLSGGCAVDGDRAGTVTPLMVAAQLGQYTHPHHGSHRQATKPLCGTCWTRARA